MKEIVKRETRWAVHIPKNYNREDYHYVKEHVTYKDGSSEPRVFLTKDFERPVWVTKQSERSYKEKKEFEDVANLVSRKTTESELNKTVAGLLGQPHLANNLQSIKESPFVYGFDLTSTSLIKLNTLRKNKYVQTPYSVAAFDIETTIDTKEILMATVTLKQGNKIKVHTAVTQQFLKGVNDHMGKFKDAMTTYLPQYDKLLDITLTTHTNVLDLLKSVFKTCNDLAPDFLSIWNMDFDIPTVLDNIARFNGKATDIICDQQVPKDLRICRYRQGVTKKVMASGKVMPVNPSLQWHSLTCTSKFYIVDAMCAYRLLRMGKSEEPSYSLDAILKKELNTQKLKFSQADEYKGALWHVFMQENYPIEYIVYNIYDCLSMMELEAKTNDLARSLPDFAGITDFARFNSQSRKLSDALFLFGAERGRIISTTPPYKEEDDIDDACLEEEDEDDLEEKVEDFKTLELKGWIQLLPQSLLVMDGLCVFEDAPFLKTNIRGLVSDVDSVSSYPSVTMACNVSKETTFNEVISIEGVDEDTFRQQNLGICLGNVNLLEYFEVIYELPSLEELDKYLAA